MGGGAGSGNSGNKHKCFRCGSENHILKDCPEKDQGGGDKKNSKLPPIEEWCKKKPVSGESQEKVVNGVTYKYCSKCLKGEGLWTIGKNSHPTSEHKSFKERKAEKANKTESGNLAMVPEAPLEVHFG